MQFVYTYNHAYTYTYTPRNLEFPSFLMLPCFGFGGSAFCCFPLAERGATTTTFLGTGDDTEIQFSRTIFRNL